jgi:autotransporter-associated beta strand protein
VNYPDGTPSSAQIELSGTAEMHIGTAHPAANCHLGYGADSSGSITMTGNSKFTVETANPYENMNWGFLNIGDQGATADITLGNYASFAVTQSQMCIAGSTGGKGHVTLNDSATFSVAGGVHLGGWAGIGAEAIVNLNGGVFTAKRFVGESSAAVLNLNGGVLKANASVVGFLQGNGLTANVQAGGAKIDTDGYTASVCIPLRHDLAPGAPAIDGGLTKLGAGTLTLNSQSVYTGPTVVNDGTLQLLSKVISQMASAPDNAAGDRADGPYALGRDFTVNAGKSIQVTQLGVFDSLGNGLDASHVVHITNTVTNAETIATIASGTSAAYQRGFRFVTLESPVSLGEGAYRVWVESIGGAGNDNFSGNLVSFDVGGSGAVSIGGSYYGVTTGVIPSTPWNDGSGDADADATFRFYDPSSVIAANALPITTPVLLGGAAGSTPKLDLQGMNQQIASLADVAGAAVKGAVVNSDLAMPVVLTLGATTGTTTYGGSIEGNLSLVKTGDSTQILMGSLT